MATKLMQIISSITINVLIFIQLKLLICFGLVVKTSNKLTKLLYSVGNKQVNSVWIIPFHEQPAQFKRMIMSHQVNERFDSIFK